MKGFGVVASSFGELGPARSDGVAVAWEERLDTVDQAGSELEVAGGQRAALSVHTHGADRRFRRVRCGCYELS